MLYLSQSNETQEGTDKEPTEVELLQDIKTYLDELKKEREEQQQNVQEEVTMDDQLQIMKDQLTVQTTQLAWLQIIICLGCVYVIVRGFYKLIASYLW